MLPSEHSAILLTCIKQWLVLKTNFRSFWEWPLASLMSENDKVPAFLENLIMSIELHGLNTEGIYRKAGSANKIKKLKDAIDLGQIGERIILSDRALDILHTHQFISSILQGSHRLEKYLNIQGCLEKSLKIKFALKNTWKTLKGLEKSLNFIIYRRIQHCLWNLNQYKIVVPLFGAAYAAPNKGTTILY